MKEILTSSSRDAWTEFVKSLDLFSHEALSKREVLLLAQVDEPYYFDSHKFEGTSWQWK